VPHLATLHATHWRTDRHGTGALYAVQRHKVWRATRQGVAYNVPIYGMELWVRVHHLQLQVYLHRRQHRRQVVTWLRNRYEKTVQPRVSVFHC